MVMLIILLLPVIICSNIEYTDLKIGPLINCTPAKVLGVYDYPKICTCKEGLHELQEDVQTSKAILLKYHPPTPKWTYGDVLLYKLQQPPMINSLVKR